MIVPRIVVGIALLILGRKAFWLFVGGVGFVLGMYVATQVVHAPRGWIVWVIALVAGLIGALLAMVLQQVAVGLAGFVAGGYVAWNLVDMLGWELGRRSAGAWESWGGFIVGGVLFALLIGALFEWALIVLSSVTGATLITQVIDVQAGVRMLVFAVLVATGIVVQAIFYRAERARSPETKTRWPEGTWR